MVSRTAAQNATATVVRNGRTMLKNIKLEQRTGAAPVLYLQIFNTNAPTVGTTSPVEVIQVPAGDTAVMIKTKQVAYQGIFGGFDLSTGFSYAVTTTPTGLTAPTATHEPLVEIHYEHLGA